MAMGKDSAQSLLRDSPVIAVSLALYLCLLPWQIELGSGTRIAPSDLILGILVVLAIPHLAIRRGSWSLWHGLTLALFPASAAYALFRYGSVTSWAILNKVVGMAILAAGFIVVSSLVRSVSDLRWVLKVFVISTSVFNAASVLLFVAGLDVPTINEDGFRLSGGLVDPNAWGGLIVVVLVLFLFMRRDRGPVLGQMLDVVLLGLLLVGLGLTESRSALIGAAAALGIWSLGSSRRLVKVYGFGVAAVVGVALLSTTSAFQSVLATVVRPSTITSRVVLLEYAIESFLANPIFGLGLGVFEERFGIIVHSSVFWIAAEMGLIGVAIVTGLVIWTLRAAIVSGRSLQPQTAALVTGLAYAHIAMIGVSLGIEALYQRHWWLVMALIAACSALISRGPRAALMSSPASPGPLRAPTPSP